MFLLDTQVLLWWFAGDTRINAELSARISDPDMLVFVSAVSVWEVVIKKSLGKLTVPNNFFEVLKKEDFEHLDVTFEHAWAVGSLPQIHNDPFDRLLIAQAKQEHLTLVTSDETLSQYNVPCLKV